jgi:glycosyltransferase involved in cell wall biosynthesis
MTQKKIRVLHLLYALGVGGTERRVLRLGNGLDSNRYDIHALTVRPVVTGGMLPWPQERHTYFPIEPGFQWARLASLAKFIRQQRFDVVHSHNWATMFYGVLGGRLAGVPVVLHGEHGRNDADRAGVPWKREVLASLLARLATRVIAVNDAISTDIQERWKLDPKKIVCMPNGVDLTRFAPHKNNAETTTDFIIGTVARFDGIKNLPCLLRAFERVHNAHPELNARLVLVGTGPDFETIQRQAQQGNSVGRIDFVGETNKPEHWYSRFDLFANTSFSEGMSNSVLEAMACGAPIVASAIPGNQCWLQDGVNALFFPSDDDAALAEQMVRLASDQSLSKRIRAENLRRVHADYDNQQFLSRYDNLYQQLLQPNK